MAINQSVTRIEPCWIVRPMRRHELTRMFDEYLVPEKRSERFSEVNVENGVCASAWIG